MDNAEVEVALVIDSHHALVGELAALFPEHEVSESDNFIGGTEVAMFFVLARPVLLKILDFLSGRRDQYRTAKLTIGTESVSLEGYSASEADALLSSPAFQRALRAIQANTKS